MSVGQIMERKERPAYVKFERLAVEDKARSAAEGHWVGRDVDYALVTPPYSKDVFKQKVDLWLAENKRLVQTERMPQDWAEQYEKSYLSWRNGQEVPLNGIPIKGWGVISPAQQETLIRMNCLTVEDLAGITDEGIQRIGMGGVDMKNKAKAWLSQLNDKGPLTQKMSAVQAENSMLKGSVETLTRQVQELTRLVKVQSDVSAPNVPHETSAITAADLLEDDDLAAQYQKKFGEPPHHRMKRETIERALKE